MLWKPIQIARDLNTSRAYVYQLIERGLLPAVRLPIANPRDPNQTAHPRHNLRVRDEDYQAFKEAL